MGPCSRRFRLVAVALVSTLVLPGAIAPAWAKKPHAEVIRLRFNPDAYAKIGVAPAIGVLVSRTFRVAAMGDARPDDERDKIGEHLDDKWLIPVLTDDSVPEFVQATAVSALARWGLTVMPQNADLILGLRVQRFFVREEDRRHEAEVSLFCRLETPGGELVWQGETSGQAHRTAKPLSAAVYNDALGEALLRALIHLVTTGELQDAVARGRGTAAASRLPRAPHTIVAVAPTTGAAREPRDVTTITARDLLSELVRLQREGRPAGALVQVVREHAIAPAPTTDDVVAFRQAGMPDAVVQAFLEKTAETAPPRGKR